jgi:hypothetical protein
VRQHLKRYYRYLGEQVYNRRNREFWNYHKNQLAALGHPMNARRVAAAATSYALDHVNPKSMARFAARPFRKTRGGSRQ